MKINEAGLAAAMALLGVTMTALIALLPLEKINGLREYAFVMFAASTPLLSFSVSLALVQKSHPLPFRPNLYIMLAGASCSIIGITLSIWAVSAISAITFAATSFAVWLLSLYVVKKQ